MQKGADEMPGKKRIGETVVISAASAEVFAVLDDSSDLALWAAGDGPRNKVLPGRGTDRRGMTVRRGDCPPILALKRFS